MQNICHPNVFLCELLLFFIVALLIDNTSDEREAESESTEVALLDDILN